MSGHCKKCSNNGCDSCKKRIIINEGPRGPRGKKGCDGKDGLDGTDGINGADGATGPTGATGHHGKNGETGPTGPIGATGPSRINGVIPFSSGKETVQLSLPLDAKDVPLTSPLKTYLGFGSSLQSTGENDKYGFTTILPSDANIFNLDVLVRAINPETELSDLQFAVAVYGTDDPSLPGNFVELLNTGINVKFDNTTDNKSVTATSVGNVPLAGKKYIYISVSAIEPTAPNGEIVYGYVSGSLTFN